MTQTLRQIEEMIFKLNNLKKQQNESKENTFDEDLPTREDM